MKLEKGGFIITKVIDYGVVKSSRKYKNMLLKISRKGLKTDARSELEMLSTRKRSVYTSDKLRDLEACMPKSVKRKREDYLKESLEDKITRNMRRKEEDNSDILKTSPTIEASAKSSKLKPKNYNQDSKLENAPLAATDVNFKGGK